MPSLPKRPGPYIAALLLIVLVILAAWLHHTVTSPELREALRRQKESRAPAALPQP